MIARLLFAASCLILTAAPNVTWAQKTPLLRFSFSSGWEALPAIVAIERGFFAQEGIIVSGMPISSTTGAIGSLAAGSTDFATVPQRTLLVMAGAKLPVTVVSMNGYGRQLELIVPKRDKRTKSIKNLRRKIIAVNSGSEAYPVLIRLLNAARLRPSDVTILRVRSQEMVRAFDKRGILVRSPKGKRFRVRPAAVFGTRHFTSALVAQKKARVILNDEGVTKAVGRIGAAPLVANRALIKRRPEQVQKFVNAWVKALFYIQKDPEDAARLMQIFFHRQGTNVTPALAKSWLGMVRYDRYIWSSNAIKDAEYNGWGLKTAGRFKFAPKLDGYIDNSFAKKALASLKRAPAPKPKSGDKGKIDKRSNKEPAPGQTADPKKAAKTAADPAKKNK